VGPRFAKKLIQRVPRDCFLVVARFDASDGLRILVFTFVGRIQRERR
jgi:hypothetical protein